MLGQEDRILQEIDQLKDEHQSISEMLDLGQISDQLQQQRLKKRKLWLKDEIARLYAFLTPDGAA